MRVFSFKRPTVLALFVVLGFFLSGCNVDNWFQDGFIPPPVPPPPIVPIIATPMPLSSVTPGSEPFPKKIIPHYPEDQDVLLQVMPGWKESQGKVNPSANDPASVGRGKESYEPNCAYCHGPEGKGDGATAIGLPTRPRNYTDGILLYGGDDWQLYRTIMYGIPNSAMKAWGDQAGGAIDPATAWDLVNYIKTLIKK